ncbi:exonuclease domain-containing protein [Quadrisphaera sp. INWT6]|uniref:exonuclease domain-containing protein n=1 Tax=Quadrisphaera sp. INWT6 TaxID=2596917 RepID=UPI0018926D71|nr:exonuclease domain-containing protein [Quadrisphaera sp. INWT6]MBF5082561.1 DEDDh family exonuclease [Quadrisphaera sp. INWT6]
MDFPATAGYAVLDLETTGFSPRTERIVEVAVVHVSPDGRAGADWSTLVHPDRSTVGATHVHGIRPADVRGAPRFADIAGALVEQLAGRVLVAHNASFDVPFLRAEFERAGVAMPEVAELCTLRESRLHLPDLLKRKLADCCSAAGVTLSGAHSALGDARATAELLGCYIRTGGPSAHAALLHRATTTPWPPVPAPRWFPELRQRRVVGGRVVASPPPSPAGAVSGAPSEFRRSVEVPRLVPLSGGGSGEPLDRPLRAGDAVVFTGGDPDVRSLLELRARERGLRVTSAVSGRTRLLVTDDPRSGTTKARRAQQLGTPVADLETAAALVEALPVVEPLSLAGPAVVDLRAVEERAAQLRAWR